MGLVSELRRRNVFRVAIAYVIIAWLILQVGDTLAPALRLADWVNTALAFFLIVGFPLAIFFAWAYELTPEGVKLEKHVDRTKSITRLTGRKLDYLIIAALALALVFFAFDKWVLDPFRDAELVQATTEAVTEQASAAAEEGKTPNSIAVLPFADLSPKGDQEYFSDGISEEILNAIAHIPELRVISRSSAFSFKGKGLDIPTVAEKLSVANILEGSVRKSGERVRITAQLIDARTDSHIWSQTYDRELKDIFAVQDEIAAAIVEALTEHLGLQIEGAPKGITATNSEAHQAYLRGRYLVVQRTPVTVDGAVREFEKAISLDPDYALAHAELTIATLLQIRTLYGGLTEAEALATASPHVERAMALDPTLAAAHAATGFLLGIQFDLEEELKYYRQAIQINPNYSIVYTWMGIRLRNLGRYAESFVATETALRLDPLSHSSRYNHVYGLIARNRHAEADRETEKLASTHPDRYALLRGMRTSLGGKWTNAVLGYLDALRITPAWERRRNYLTGGFAAIGLEKEALDIAEHPSVSWLNLLGKHGDAITTAEARLAEDPDSLDARRDLGLALASAGDYARARPILEEMWQRSGGRVTCCGLFRWQSAAALIALRRDAGEEAAVGELVAAIRDNVRRYREAGIVRDHRFLSVDYEEGLADFLAGEREKGLALIAKAAEDGYFILQKEAYLQVLYEDPGFPPIREMQEARQARERKRFLAIVCADNPYEVFWKPAQGTCEKYVPVDGW